MRRETAWCQPPNGENHGALQKYVREREKGLKILGPMCDITLEGVPMVEHLRAEISDGVAIVTLTSPTMPPAFFAECEKTFRGFSAEAGLRAVVIRSSGKAFSYGLDLPAAMQEYGHLFQDPGNFLPVHGSPLAVPVASAPRTRRR